MKNIPEKIQFVEISQPHRLQMKPVTVDSFEAALMLAAIAVTVAFFIGMLVGALAFR